MDEHGIKAKTAEVAAPPPETKDEVPPENKAPWWAYAIGFGLVLLILAGVAAYLYSGSKKDEKEIEQEEEEEDQQGGTRAGASAETEHQPQPYRFAWDPKKKGSGLALARDNQEVVATKAPLSLVLADRGFAAPLDATAQTFPEFSLRIESSSLPTPRLLLGFCLASVSLSKGLDQPGVYGMQLDRREAYFNGVQLQTAHGSHLVTTTRPKVGDVVKARYTGTALEFYNTSGSKETLMYSGSVVLPAGTYYAFCGHGSAQSSFSVLHE